MAIKVKKGWCSVLFDYLMMHVFPTQQTCEPHQGDAHMSTADGKILLALVVMSLMSIRQLLILAGDVELNPGPLGQHGEGKVTFVTAV